MRQREEKERERAAERQTERVNQRVEQTIRRVVRQLRAMRAGRLAPVERIAQSFRQWLGERLGVEQAQRVVERETITQQVTHRQSRGIRM